MVKHCTPDAATPYPYTPEPYPVLSAGLTRWDLLKIEAIKLAIKIEHPSARWSTIEGTADRIFLYLIQVSATQQPRPQPGKVTPV